MRTAQTCKSGVHWDDTPSCVDFRYETLHGDRNTLTRGQERYPGFARQRCRVRPSKLDSKIEIREDTHVIWQLEARSTPCRGEYLESLDWDRTQAVRTSPEA